MALRDLLLLAVLMASIPFVLYRPWLGILLWYWIGIMNPHRLTWGFMYDFPVAMLAAGVTLVALVIARDRLPPPATKEIFLLCALAFWCTVTTYLAWVPDAAWNYWEQFVKVVLFTLITPMLVHGRVRVEWLVIVITASLAFYGVKGGLFTIMTGGQAHVLGPARSFISGNTNLGLAMIMVLPLILVLARQLVEERLGCLSPTKWTRLAGWGSYAAFWLTGLATLFTFSRGAMVGLGAIAPFLFAKMRRKLVLVLMVVLAVGAIGITVPDRLAQRAESIENYRQDGSAMSRIQAWNVAWNIALENPVTGAGFGMASMGDQRWLSYDTTDMEKWWPQQARATHSNYFQVLGHHGFVGLALYLGLLGSISLSLFRLARNARKRAETVWIGEYAWAILVGLVGYAVAGAFLDMAYFTLFYAFVALAVILRREYEWVMQESAEAEPGPAEAAPSGRIGTWPGADAGPVTRQRRGP